MIKISNKCQSLTNSQNSSKILTPKNKSFFYSLDKTTNNNSPKYNEPETYLLNSLYKIKYVRNFQKRSLFIKRSTNSSIKNSTNSVYQNYIRARLNIPEVKLLNSKSINSSKTKDFTTLNSTKNSNQIKKHIDNSQQHSSLRKNNIHKITFIGQKLNDELLNIYSFKNNFLGINEYNNRLIFNQSVRKRILLKSFIND